ncbi:MAG: MBL fold metallo-hydrolase [Ilumatobacteraceae bacterium]
MTILGPGRGECCLVHVGAAEWLIVDSCTTESGQPAALAYLDTMGVPYSQVRWIVATHWHDDHIRGFADLVAACPNAKVIQSAALESDEFMALAAAAADSLVDGSFGAQEVWRTWTHLVSAGRSSPELARSDYRIHLRQGVDEPSCEVWALSPSGASVAAAIAEFGRALPKIGEPKRAVPRPKRNPSCVVIWVQVGETVALLGADLETSADEAHGWRGIVHSSGRPTGRAHVLKVPHHGSIDAHDEVMWNDLLVPQPKAAVTPFQRGDVRLPRETDRTRIAGLSDAWLTRDSATSRSPRRSNAVERTIREAVRQIALVSVNPGRVTFRCDAQDPGNWAVDAPSPAVKL